MGKQRISPPGGAILRRAWNGLWGSDGSLDRATALGRTSTAVLHRAFRSVYRIAAVTAAAACAAPTFHQPGIGDRPRQPAERVAVGSEDCLDDCPEGRTPGGDRARGEATGDRTSGSPRRVLLGKASYYANSLAGNKTASGERYDPRALTAAHRSLPFGTMVRVTRVDTGGSVVVRVTDRGPFAGADEGRIIDLSRAAAEKLEMLRAGVVDVRVEVIE